MKRVIAIVLAVVLILSLNACGDSGNIEYPADAVNANTRGDKNADLGTEILLTINRCVFDGLGGNYVDQNIIRDGELGNAIFDCLSALSETGETVPEIAPESEERSRVSPAESGTTWVFNRDVGLFRLNSDMTEICKVERRLGEGKVFEMTDELKQLLWDAWLYYPNDCWKGVYELTGDFTFEHRYAAKSAVDMIEVESISFGGSADTYDTIKLNILANEGKKVEVVYESYQSPDNLGSYDIRAVKLKKGEYITEKFQVYGFDYTYWITIMIDNTRVELTIQK